MTYEHDDVQRRGRAKINAQAEISRAIEEADLTDPRRSALVVQALHAATAGHYDAAAVDAESARTGSISPGFQADPSALPMTKIAMVEAFQKFCLSPTEPFPR